MTARPVSPGDPRHIPGEPFDWAGKTIRVCRACSYTWPCVYATRETDGHTFYASGADGDLCRTCGRDIREHIHPATEPMTAAPATEVLGLRLRAAHAGFCPDHGEAEVMVGGIHVPERLWHDLLDRAALPEGRETVLREALEEAAANNHDEGRHSYYAGPGSFRDCSDGPCRSAARALAAALAAAPEVPVDRIDPLDVDRLTAAIASLGSFSGVHAGPRYRAELIVEADRKLRLAPATDRHGPDPAKERCRACGELWPCPLVVADGMRTRGTDRTDR